MGVRIASVVSNTILNSPIVTTAETVVVSSGPLGLAVDNAIVLITWEVVVTLTAGTTAITPRLRRGLGTTDTLINIAQAINVAATTTVKMSGSYRDQPGVAAALNYSLTLQMTGAAANSTPNDVCLTAFVL